MKQARFTDPAGYVRTGEWTDDGIETGGRTYSPDEVDLLAPVEAHNVFGVGRNYHKVFEGTDEEPPDRPRIWWKGGTNVVSSPNSTVTLPSEEVVFEAELGVVIGEECRDVPEDDVMDVIAGFTCVDDLSDQTHTDDATLFRVKSFDNAAPMGPVVVPPENVPENPRIQLWVNGEKRQDSAGDEHIFPVREAVSEFSRFVTLHPDDVIMMGTPVGFAPLADGDEVRIQIEGIGTLEHDVEIR